MNTTRTAAIFVAAVVAALAAGAYTIEARKAAEQADLASIPHVTIVAKRLTPAEKLVLREQELQAARARAADPRA
ncbi:hypothetical protein E4K72_21865 [Oxalobacteraceae bacterium OM1]|nr:hypothetical protein E4K72_21865 [Oxalobacteraceae bacterium OM1]